MSQEKGLDHWKSHQFRSFDDMIRQHADLYHWSQSRLKI